MGPKLPYHDLAHFVVERMFGLQDGFFGNIQRGFTPAQLSDKLTIMRLGPAPYRAEILARALASLQTGACAREDFEVLVNAELVGLSLSTMCIAAEVRDAMTVEFNGLVEAYDALRDGDAMVLEFGDSGSAASRPASLCAVRAQG